MPNMDFASAVGALLGAAILAVAAALLLFLWRSRTTRENLAGILTAADRAFFGGQDLRRSSVILIMGLLGVALIVGSRIPYRLGATYNPLFVRVWVGVVALILILVLLATLDWFASRVYARRRRKELLREGIELVRRERKVKEERRGAGGD